MQTFGNTNNQHRDGTVLDHLAGMSPSIYEQLMIRLSASLMSQSVPCLPIVAEHKISYASDLGMS